MDPFEQLRAEENRAKLDHINRQLQDEHIQRLENLSPARDFFAPGDYKWEVLRLSINTICFTLLMLALLYGCCTPR